MIAAIITVLTGIASVVGILRWARFIAGRYGAPKWARYVGPVCVTVMALGPIGTIIGLIRTFNAVGAAGQSAADRTRILANGISEAMYNTAIGLGIGVACVIVLLVMTWRYHWSAKLPKPEGSPPYR